MTEEAELLEAARLGDDQAMSQIFDLYASALFRYAFRLCHDRCEADRIVGDVFGQLMEHLSRGKGPRTNLRAYLYQVTYHLLVEHVREASRLSSLEPVLNVPDAQRSVPMLIEERELLRALEEAVLQRLTDEQRHVILLRFVEGLSLKETSEITGKSVNCVCVLQSRAISKLRRSLCSKFGAPVDYELRPTFVSSAA